MPRPEVRRQPGTPCCCPAVPSRKNAASVFREDSFLERVQFSRGTQSVNQKYLSFNRDTFMVCPAGLHEIESTFDAATCWLCGGLYEIVGGSAGAAVGEVASEKLARPKHRTRFEFGGKMPGMAEVS